MGRGGTRYMLVLEKQVCACSILKPLTTSFDTLKVPKVETKKGVQGQATKLSR